MPKEVSKNRSTLGFSVANRRKAWQKLPVRKIYVNMADVFFAQTGEDR